MIYVNNWIDYYSDFVPFSASHNKLLKSYIDSSKTNPKVLSVEAGTAIGVEDLPQNYDITIIDKYPEFTSLLTKRQSLQNNRFHIFNLDPMDIGRYLGKNFFDLIYCLDGRIIFFKDRTLIKKFFFDSKMLLAENGKLVLSLYNFSKVNFKFDSVEISERICTRGVLHGSFVKDKKNLVYKLNTNIISADGKQKKIAKDETVVPLGIETVKSFAKELNFSSVEFYSDYNKTPLSDNSEYFVCILTK